MKQKTEIRKATEAAIYISLGACVYELSVQGPANFRFLRIVLIGVVSFALIMLAVRLKDHLQSRK